MRSLLVALLLLSTLAVVQGSFRIEFESFLSSGAAADTLESSTEAYDFVFDVQSISELTGGDGWPLLIRNWTQGVQILKQEFQGSICSVLGMYNRGKTWFFNRLAGTTLEAGMTTHTLGLSFKEPKGFGFDAVKSRVLLLDTAGTMAPVTQSQHTGQAPDIDRMEVETFLTEVILDLSVNLIYVVNDLTWPEQQFIDSILKVRRAKKDSRVLEPGVDDILIVVHNWRYQNHNQMEVQFNDFVRRCYPIGEKVTLDTSTGAFYWSSKLEKSSGSQNQTFVIEHFFLASESIGNVATNKRWNDVTLAEIRRIITSVPPIIASRKRMILQEVVNQINQRLKNYFVLTDEGKTATDIVHLVLEGQSPKLVLKNPRTVVKKKDFHAPVCIPQPQKKTDLELPYVVYMTTTHVVVRVEVPGLNSLEKVKYSPKQGKLEIRGEMPSLETIEGHNQVRRVMSGNQSPASGSWEVVVNLRSIDDILLDEDLRINNGKPEQVSLKAGVLVFKYGFEDRHAPTQKYDDAQAYAELSKCQSACKQSSASSWLGSTSTCLQLLKDPQKRRSEL